MIDAGERDGLGRAVTLRPVADDWRAIADVAPLDRQRDFVPALAARYMLLSTLEGEWTSMGIYVEDQPVGHVMWGTDDEGACWIGGLMVDAAHQGRGIGTAATATLIGWLRAQHGNAPIRLSYHPNNSAAAALYDKLGFELTGAIDEGEIVAEHRAAGRGHLTLRIDV